jgi:hypothetical protein
MKIHRAIGASSFVNSILALSFLLMFCTASFAGTTAGVVAQVSGTLSAKKADGTVKTLSVQSTVEEGDLLVTEKKSFARLKFIDNSEVVLRPITHFRVARYSFDQAAPKDDKAYFDLIKGGVRSVTGMIGKRADQNSYRLTTSTAVIGIRGTTYEARICEGDCGSIPDGLYLYVLEGIIHVENKAGSMNISAGQYVYVKSADVLPLILPGNPGFDFSLPQIIPGHPGFDFTLPLSVYDQDRAGGGTAAEVIKCEECEVR